MVSPAITTNNDGLGLSRAFWGPQSALQWLRWIHSSFILIVSPQLPWQKTEKWLPVHSNDFSDYWETFIFIHQWCQLWHTDTFICSERLHKMTDHQRRTYKGQHKPVYRGLSIQIQSGKEDFKTGNKETRGPQQGYVYVSVHCTTVSCTLPWKSSKEINSYNKLGLCAMPHSVWFTQTVCAHWAACQSVSDWKCTEQGREPDKYGLLSNKVLYSVRLKFVWKLD